MRALVCLAVLALTVSARADEASDMHAAAEGFYGAYATFHPSDGIPDAAGQAKYAPHISPALGTLLVEAGRAEAAFAAANKGSPPLIEGDLFTSNFEGATSVKVGACSGDAKAGHCSVALVYAEGTGKPVSWSDTLYLAATASGWRVDDIGYGAPWEFGNKGRLSKTLKDTIDNAGN